MYKHVQRLEDLNARGQFSTTQSCCMTHLGVHSYCDCYWLLELVIHCLKLHDLK